MLLLFSLDSDFVPIAVSEAFQGEIRVPNIGTIYVLMSQPCSQGFSSSHPNLRTRLSM